MPMHRWIIPLIAASLFAGGLPAHALDYRLPDLENRIQSLEQYRGKWVVVNYWATWCGTCRRELPDLAALHEAHQDRDIVVVGINFESIDLPRLQSFVAEQALPYPILRSGPVPGTPLGPVPALPTTYIIDPRGTVVAGEIGLVSRQAIEDYIATQRSP